jgi:hypothetical protein
MRLIRPMAGETMLRKKRPNVESKSRPRRFGAGGASERDNSREYPENKYPAAWQLSPTHDLRTPVGIIFFCAAAGKSHALFSALVALALNQKSSLPVVKT